jgi:uncharacterized protein
MERFVIHKQVDKHFYTVLLTQNGRIILRGKNCSNLPECKNLINSIRRNAGDYSKFELMTANDGKYYFKVKESNGDEIARSEIFEDTAERYGNIGLVRRTISFAIFDDQLFTV